MYKLLKKKKKTPSVRTYTILFFDFHISLTFPTQNLSRKSVHRRERVHKRTGGDFTKGFVKCYYVYILFSFLLATVVPFRPPPSPPSTPPPPPTPPPRPVLGSLRRPPPPTRPSVRRTTQHVGHVHHTQTVEEDAQPRATDKHTDNNNNS